MIEELKETLRTELTRQCSIVGGSCNGLPNGRLAVNLAIDQDGLIRAILERMREPTEAMLDAGADQLVGSASEDWQDDAKRVFVSMLSAIDEKGVG